MNGVMNLTGSPLPVPAKLRYAQNVLGPRHLCHFVDFPLLHSTAIFWEVNLLPFRAC